MLIPNWAKLAGVTQASPVVLLHPITPWANRVWKIQAESGKPGAETPRAGQHAADVWVAKPDLEKLRQAQLGRLKGAERCGAHARRQSALLRRRQTRTQQKARELAEAETPGEKSVAARGIAAQQN